jgi:hypothetical protein
MARARARLARARAATWRPAGARLQRLPQDWLAVRTENRSRIGGIGARCIAGQSAIVE